MANGTVVPGEWLQAARRTRLIGKAGIISVVEAFSRGSVSVCLIAFASLYSVEAYAKLLPWVACQQLITVLAPFGTLDVLGKLISIRGDGSSLYRSIPRYVRINTVWIAPLAWGLTWLGSRGAVSMPTPLESILVVASGSWLASQRTQQAVNLLSGQTINYARLRITQGGTHVVVACGLALLHVSPMLAFFSGQLSGLVAAHLTAVAPPVARPDVPVPNVPFWDIVRHSWIFGIWAIFGWFSGYGATVILGRVTNAHQIAEYGQVIAFVGLMQLGLGGVAMAMIRRFLEGNHAWGEATQVRVDRVYDGMCMVVAAFCAIASLARIESSSLIHHLGLIWPHYVWTYFFAVFAGLTLYQRTILRYQYDNGARIPWLIAVASEATGLFVFQLLLRAWPDQPLYASVALISARCIIVFWFGKDRGFAISYRRRLVTVGMIVATVFGLHALSLIV